MLYFWFFISKESQNQCHPFFFLIDSINPNTTYLNYPSPPPPSILYLFYPNILDTSHIRYFFKNLFSKATLSTNNKFVFSQKEKGFIPSSLPLAPKRIKPPLFLFGNQGESLAYPFLASALRRHCCLLIPTLQHHETGERQSL